VAYLRWHESKTRAKFQVRRQSYSRWVRQDQLSPERHTGPGTARNLFVSHLYGLARGTGRMTPTRILHVAAPGVVGGLERVLRILAVAQRASGDEVHVAALLGDTTEAIANPLLEALRAAGVAVHPLAVPTRAYLRERAAVADLAMTHRVDIIHTHGYRADVIDGSISRQLPAVAGVTTVHGFTGGGVRNRCYEWLQRRSFRRFDAVVGVSQLLAEQLMQAGVPSSRVHVVRNAWQASGHRLDRVAARRSLGVPDDAFVVGWVGRISHEKGADVMLDALEHLEGLPVCVQILGDGRERRALELRARERWPATKVVWRGIVPDAERLFSGFDVFVNSSRTEGTPMVLFEAMAAGVPIVATRVGGVPDVLGAEDALIVAPESPPALAAAVREVFRNPSGATSRAHAAQLRLERECRVDSWVEEYRNVYQSAMTVARAER
jgi:glycosyltransferase involved in cell wall biosynthesis